MSTNLHHMLAENMSDLEEEVFLQLSADSDLYRHSPGTDLLRDRVASLVGAFWKSLEDDPSIFVSYVEAIAEERIDEGVVLHELQLALQVLEEKTWELVVQEIPPASQVHSLGLVTLIIGTAKDHIAEIYLHHLKAAESAMGMMRRDAGIQEPDLGVEDDLNWQRGHDLAHGRVF